MSICIYGAGAIGCWIAARLIQNGHTPSLVARGAHLQALQRDGLTVTEAGQTQNLPVDAYGDTDEIPHCDFVLVTLKAHSVTNATPHLIAQLDSNSTALFAVNGIPWWFFYGLGQAFEESTVESVDPDGSIWKNVRPDRTLGCVIYPAVELVAPGVIRHISGNRMSIGEPRGGQSKRTDAISNLLNSAGIRTSVRKDIRNEMWIKLWGNVAFNPLSVLTGATLDILAGDDSMKEIVTDLMRETQAVGQHYGARFGMTIDKRIRNAASVGAHKTSMLQDYLHRKPLEKGAILDAVLELATFAQIDTPTIRRLKTLLDIKLITENHPQERTLT